MCSYNLLARALVLCVHWLLKCMCSYSYYHYFIYLAVDMIRSFGLSEEDAIKRVSDIHMQEISRSYCSQWRMLYSHLEVEKIVVLDVDRMNVSEQEKRHTFFAEWRERKGSDSTYIRLLYALLKIGCREDAEGVCKLLALTVPKSHT